MQVGGIQKRTVASPLPKVSDEEAGVLLAARPNAYSEPTSKRSKHNSTKISPSLSSEHVPDRKVAHNGSQDKITGLEEEESVNAEVHDRLNHLPVVDLDDSFVQEHFFKGYNVQRLPYITVDSMDEISENFLQHVISKSRQKYRKSSWLAVWKTVNDDWAALAEQQRSYSEYANLTNMLATGQLYGCELRGNPRSRKYGLIATKSMPERTVVAVECGVLYSEREHDRLVRDSGDIMIGLKGNYIDASLLAPLANSKEWNRYQRCRYQGTVPGFVMDSSTHGNETSFIGCWNFTDSPCDSPNLESFAVIDLKHSVVTVAFETVRQVEKGEELLLDAGCWDQVSRNILPGQAQMSQMLEKRYQILRAIAKNSCTTIDEDSLEKARETAKPIYFSAKAGLHEVIEDFGKGCKYGDIYDLLGGLREDGPDVLKASDDDSVWGVPANGIVDPNFEGLYFAVQSKEEELLKPTTKKLLNRVPASAGTAFHSLREELLESYRSCIEIVEIVDPKHPAKLFSIPGEPAFGVRAKQHVSEGSAVLAYGGTIEQFANHCSDNMYIYDITEFLPTEYRGPELFINGSSSVGGRLNDAWSPTGDAEENLEVIQHWDERTNTPQLLFRASRDIKKGEELLYDYGSDYWKVMFRRLVEDHARFAAETNEQCKLLRQYICQHTGWDKNRLRRMETKLLSR